jgi:dCMP deaminase
MNWTEYFCEIVNIVSKKSPCERLQVGCIIVNDENRILSTGYNGFPSGYKHISNVETKVLYDGTEISHEQNTIHAEINAICFAAKQGISLQNSIMYITHYPCIHCFKSILSSGIKHIYYLYDYKNDKNIDLLVDNVENIEDKITITKIK